MPPAFGICYFLSADGRLDIVRFIERPKRYQRPIDPDDLLDEAFPGFVIELIVGFQSIVAVLSGPAEGDGEVVNRILVRRRLTLKTEDAVAKLKHFAPDCEPFGNLGTDRCTFPIDAVQEGLPFVSVHGFQFILAHRKRLGPRNRTHFDHDREDPVMPPCDRCGVQENLPYRCRYCGGTFCGDHRLPESHNCVGLDDWDDPSGVFDSGFDDGLGPDSRRGPPSTLERLGIDTGPGGHLAYFRNNMTFVFLGLMVLTYFLQVMVESVFGSAAHSSLFVLESVRLLDIWTWVTSIFAHGSPMHLLFNAIVLYFFGPIVERKVGSKMFTLLFLGAGMAAGLAQVGVGLLISQPGAVVGASGAILAVMGVLTVLNPNLRVLLFFVVPMPLWLLTLGFAAFSVVIMMGGGIGAGQIAHLAHLIGLVIGLIYGEQLRRAGKRAPDQLQFGGGRPPGGGRRRF